MPVSPQEAPNSPPEERIRHGRMRFIAMVIAYTLGNFNDNFNKQAVSLLALTYHHTSLQGWIGIAFTIPFLLFAAPAGWLADRFPRRRVIILAKMLEVVLLGMGGVGIMTLNWSFILIVVFFMAIQATIFGTSLTGSIPDVFPEKEVVHANARLTSATTAGILLGVVAAGLALNFKGMFHGLPQGRLIAASMMIIVSIIGLIASFGAPRCPAGNPKAPFPWAGPIDSIKNLWELRTDRLLIAAILSNAYFWFIAALQVLFINKMGIIQFGLDYAATSYLALAELLGVTLGAIVAGNLVAKDNGLWVTPMAAMGLALFLCLIGISPIFPLHLRLIYVLAMLVCAGVAGGIMMVPLGSFFQTRPLPERRGRVIAVSWFTWSVGIVLGSGLYLPLEKSLESTIVFILMGMFTLPVAMLMSVVFMRRKPMP